MADRLIFVSCGQLRPDERRLGQRITSEIDAVPGFKEHSVRRRLIKHHGFEKNRASEVLRKRRTVLSEENLVQLRHVYDGDEMSLHPYWEWYVRHTIGPTLPGDRGA